MGLAEVLTIIFVVLKLVGVIDWSWWLVLLPEIIAVGLYILGGSLKISLRRKIKQIERDWYNDRNKYH